MKKYPRDNDYVSPTFEAFKKNTVIISERRAADRQKIDPGYDPDIDPAYQDSQLRDHYKSGYGKTSREVMIPAFLAAYTKSNPNKSRTWHFPVCFKNDAKLAD